MNKKILYIDLDGVLADYENSAIRDYRQPEFFKNLPLVPGAWAAFDELCELFDVYILSTAPWSVPLSWYEKRLWVERRLGSKAFKRLILSHNKGLLKGDYLVDDREENGVSGFEGKVIKFGSAEFPNWESVLTFLINEAFPKIKFKDIKEGQRFRFLSDPKHVARIAQQVGRVEIYCPIDGSNTMGHSKFGGEEVYLKSDNEVILL